MSEPPTAVTLVDYSGDEESIMAQSVFDSVPEALDAVEVLMRMWAIEETDEKRIEVQRV